jgi:hypothetical protein
VVDGDFAADVQLVVQALPSARIRDDAVKTVVRVSGLSEPDGECNPAPGRKVDHDRRAAGDVRGVGQLLPGS